MFFVVRRRFVDDLHSCDTEANAEGHLSASAVTRQVVETLLGWKFDDDKRVNCASATTVLGVEVSLSSGLAMR